MDMLNLHSATNDASKLRNYNFEEVVSVSSFVYGYLAFVPTGLWLYMRQYQSKTTLVSNICLYGYSMFIYIPAVVSREC